MKHFIGMISVLLLLTSCEGEKGVPPLADLDSAYDAAGRLKLEKSEAGEYPDLHNVFRLSDDIISGSEPHGEKALERIAKMGVKTLISVDGKVPDAATAEKLGMRYVHVPIQYRGITDDELTRIAKTFREMEGPFFVHCFHGKHRGPAAAAVGRVVLDGASRERAMAEMRQWCGTSKKYEGLYGAIASSEIPTDEDTRNYHWDFPSAQPFTGFRELMIRVSRAHDHLKLLSRRDWEEDPQHPDVDAFNEAGKLEELFERGRNLEEVKARPEDFQRWMNDSSEESGLLCDHLAKDRKEEAGRAFDAVGNLCSKCHSAYRND
jgi:protein tyrosine phosphatase (PTP) superfamily phosphohydrolase (DUF442 family)